MVACELGTIDIHSMSWKTNFSLVKEEKNWIFQIVKQYMNEQIFMRLLSTYLDWRNKRSIFYYAASRQAENVQLYTQNTRNILPCKWLSEFLQIDFS